VASLDGGVSTNVSQEVPHSLDGDVNQSKYGINHNTFMTNITQHFYELQNPQ